MQKLISFYIKKMGILLEKKLQKINIYFDIQIIDDTISIYNEIVSINIRTIIENKKNKK